MVKVGSILGLGAILGYVTGASAHTLTIQGVRADDTPRTLADRIYVNYSPNGGTLYIIDLDYDEGPGPCGCKQPCPTRQPKIIFRGGVEVVDGCGGDYVFIHLIYRPPSDYSEYPVCVTNFSYPTLRPFDASHRFQVWFTESPMSAIDEEDVWQLLDKLSRTEGALSAQYCLTPGESGNRCRCVAPHLLSLGELRVSKVNEKYPSLGDRAPNFFRHFSTTGGNGGVIYVIDIHHDDVWGKGGCISRRDPSGKIVAVLTDVGHPTSCQGTSTKIALGNGENACMDPKHEFFRPPPLPEGDVMHEWKLWLTGDRERFASLEQSASGLARALEAAKLPSVSLCFEEGVKYALTGPCRCKASPSASGKPLTIGRVTAEDKATVIAQSINMNPLPTTGRLYILDRDYDEGPRHAGCARASPTKHPKLVFRAYVGFSPPVCPFGIISIPRPEGSHPSEVHICVERFSHPYLRPGDAAHRFEVYYSTEAWTEDEQAEGEWFRTKLIASGSPSTQYCLKYGENTNKCNCQPVPRMSPGSIEISKVDNKNPSQGEDFAHFFRHARYVGSPGEVLYFIDTHYDPTPGQGGCDRDSPSPGKIMAVLTNVGVPGPCPESSIKVSMFNSQGACMEKRFDYTSPAVAEGELMHEWKVYASNYRFTMSESSAANLVEDLEAEKSKSITLCFHEDSTEANVGPCLCQATKGAPRIFVSGVKDSDSARVLAERIWFDNTPASGIIYIIDLDFSTNHWSNGCDAISSADKDERVILVIDVGTDECVGGEKAQLWDRQIPVCIKNFIKPQLWPTLPSRRFQIFFSLDKKIASSATSGRETRDAFLQQFKSSGGVSTFIYCLTYGDDTNDCHCARSGRPDVGERQVFYKGETKYPGTGVAAEKIFEAIINGRFSQGVMYIIDVHYDKIPGKGGCSKDKHPSGKIIAIMNHPGRHSEDQVCAAQETKIKLDYGGESACLENSVEYSPPTVPKGDIMHEWRIYSFGYRLSKAEGSASELLDALEARKALSTSLCFHEDGRDTTRGPCVCDQSESVQTTDPPHDRQKRDTTNAGIPDPNGSQSPGANHIGTSNPGGSQSPGKKHFRGPNQEDSLPISPLLRLL